MARKPTYEEMEQRVKELEREASERKKAEDALRESEKKYRTILKSIEESYYEVDLAGNLTFFNDSTSSILGYTRDELVGINNRQFMDQENAEKVYRTFNKVYTTGKPAKASDWEIMRKDGARRFVEASMSLIRDEKGKPAGFRGIGRDITERKRVEEALKESEAKYRELADSITDVFFAMDKNLRYTYWNKASEKLTGIAEKDAIGKSLFEIFPDSPETRKAERAYREVLKTGKSNTFIIEYPLKGKRPFFDITAYPSGDGLSVFVRDITKQKQMELTLWESEERYRTLFNGVPAGLYRTTPDGKILDANMALVEIMGYPNRETILRANSRESYVNPKDSEFFQAEVEKQGAIYGFETQLYRYDGTPVWVEINARLEKKVDGGILYYEGSLTDITERKHAEKRITFLAEVLSSSPLSVIATDKGEKITYVNPATERLFGYTHDELLGKSPIILNSDPNAEKLQRDIFDTIGQGKVWRGEILNKKKNGDLFPIFASVYQLLDEQGNFIAVVGFQEDITEHKQAEAKLMRSHEQLRKLADHLQSVREEERTNIAREIHDELGQALTGLKMDLSWMAKKIPEDQPQLLDKVNLMSELTGTTLKTVQKISTELRPGLLDDLGLVAAIEWQAEEFQNRTGIRCTLTVDPENITADDRRSTALFRIFQETLTNVARHAQATRVHVSLQEKDGDLELRVRDNGIGITKEQISNPASFGLIGIKERVHSWGGKVTISGRPGKGTTVVAKMPF